MESKRILGKIVSNKMWTSLKICLIYVDTFLVMIKVLLEKEIEEENFNTDSECILFKNRK